MTADVVAFLRAAFDEVERVAGAASYGGTWTDAGDWDTARVEDSQRRRLARVHSEADARHIALHDPRAALARVQAERHLLAIYDWLTNGRPGLPDEQPLYSSILDGVSDPVEAEHDFELVFQWLAYGHRHTIPGYDPAWAPEGVSADA